MARKRLGITRKKTPQYRERDEEKREAYRERLKDIPKERRIYLDESGCHKLNRTHGYAKKGAFTGSLTENARAHQRDRRMA